ncbi:hypothetical protein D3C72_2284900 [compost metagenome]
MAVLGAVLAVERIPAQHSAATVEIAYARMPGSALAAKQRQQVGEMLHEAEAGIELALVPRRIEAHR